MEEHLNLSDFLIVLQKLAKQNGIEWRPSFFNWDLPEDVAADFTLTLPLQLAYKNKKNPLVVAQELINSLNCSEWQPTIAPPDTSTFACLFLIINSF